MGNAPGEDPPRLPAIGDRVAGKYRVERLLGTGGMGAVFVAEHEILHERVALKFLLPEVARDEAMRARFLNEARAAARIKSEHVARVMDVADAGAGGAFIVLELLEGADLGDVLTRRGPLPAEEAAAYVLQALEGLAQAHALGIVHRDLKPTNLFVARRPDGSACVKVLDFGVSKLASQIDQGVAPITAATALVGSPLFMSPEQMRDPRGVDARADVWSVGVILFNLVSGTMPFDAPTLGGAFASVLTDAPKRLRDAAPGAPEALERIVARCLAKAPADRYPDVAALAEDLVAVAPGERVAAERVARIARARQVLASEHPSSSPRAIDLAPTIALTPREGDMASLPGVAASSAPSATSPTPSGRALVEPTLASARTFAESPAAPAVASGKRASLAWGIAAVCGVIAVGAAAYVATRDDAGDGAAIAAASATRALPEDMPARAPVERGSPPSSSPATAPVAALPRDCADARARGAADDGPQRIDPDGAGPLRPFEVHCAGMREGAPRAYVTLVHPESNVTTYVWTGGPCACPDLNRRFARVRIDPRDMTLDATDGAFATYDRALDCEAKDRSHCGERVDLAWGGAGSCRARGDASGRASIDLRGTPFALADDAAFVPSGFAAAGRATIGADRRTATLEGGGLCGAMVSSTAPKIRVVEAP